MKIKFNAILERIKVVDYRNYIVGIKKEDRHLVAVKRPVVIFQTSSIFYKQYKRWCSKKSSKMKIFIQVRTWQGPLLTEVHTIQRTSPNVYRVSSFDFDCCRYESFKELKGRSLRQDIQMVNQQTHMKAHLRLSSIIVNIGDNLIEERNRRVE